MASIVPLVRQYAYVWLRFKMGIRQISLTSSAILCLYGDTKVVFPIGGLVAIGETPIAADSRYYRRLILFMLKLHDHLLFIPSSKGTKRSYACQNYIVFSGR